MSRILSVDYGRKRIGLAATDPLGITVQPVAVINRTSLNRDLDAIKKIAEDKDITQIIMGLPVNMDGTPGILQDEIKKFASKLKEATGINIEFCDERLTTYEAEQMLIQEAGLSRNKREKVKDKLAACLILKRYLSKKAPDLNRG